MDIKEATERQKKILRHFNKDEKSHLKRILLSEQYGRCGEWVEDSDSQRLANMTDLFHAYHLGKSSILFFKFLKGVGPGSWSSFYSDNLRNSEIIESMSCALEDVPLYMGGPHESSIIAKYRLEICK